MSIMEMREFERELVKKEINEGLTKSEKETLDAVWEAIDLYDMQAINDLF